MVHAHALLYASIEFAKPNVLRGGVESLSPIGFCITRDDMEPPGVCVLFVTATRNVRAVGGGSGHRLCLGHDRS